MRGVRHSVVSVFCCQRYQPKMDSTNGSVHRNMLRPKPETCFDRKEMGLCTEQRCIRPFRNALTGGRIKRRDREGGCVKQGTQVSVSRLGQSTFARIAGGSFLRLEFWVERVGQAGRQADTVVYCPVNTLRSKCPLRTSWCGCFGLVPPPDAAFRLTTNVPCPCICPCWTCPM